MSSLNLHDLDQMLDASELTQSTVDAVLQYVAECTNEIEKQCVLSKAVRMFVGKRLERIGEVAELCYCHHDGTAVTSCNLGALFIQLGDHSRAEEMLRLSLLTEPTLTTAYINLITLHLDNCNPYLALEVSQQLVDIEPTPKNLYRLGVNELAIGRFAEGFSRFDKRLVEACVVLNKPKGYSWVETHKIPEWEGARVDHLLVMMEQGFGDNIQFFRFIADALKLAKRITFSCNPVMVSLFNRQLANVIAVDENMPLPSADAWCSVMSIPTILGMKSVSCTRYLTIEPSEKFADVISSTLPNIGFTWSGNPANLNDHTRSVPIAKLTPLLLLDTIQWHNIHQNKTCGFGNVVNVMERSTNFRDTAEYIAQLDSVVAIDSALCHLAGAMGVPTHLLCRRTSEWRWGHDTSTKSLWYDAVTIHRQHRHGDWDSAVMSLLLTLVAKYGISAQAKANIMHYYKTQNPMLAAILRRKMA